VEFIFVTNISPVTITKKMNNKRTMVNAIIKQLNNLNTKVYGSNSHRRQVANEINDYDTVKSIVIELHNTLRYCDDVFQQFQKNTSFDKFNNDKQLNLFCSTNDVEKRCTIYTEDSDQFIRSFESVSNECILLLREYGLDKEKRENGYRITYVNGSIWWNSTTEFVKQYPPSTTTKYQCAWLAVASSDHKDDGFDGADPDRMAVKWYEINKTWNQDEITKQVVCDLAKEFSVLSGKWMIFLDNSNVDKAWSIIAEATAAGKLGNYSKVSPYHPSDSEHVICIYTDDFTDESDVFRIRQSLTDLGFTEELNYKPDAYTYLGIYKDNKWNISPVVYWK
jgi:hypothetical protein